MRVAVQQESALERGHPGELMRQLSVVFGQQLSGHLMPEVGEAKALTPSSNAIQPCQHGSAQLRWLDVRVLG